VCNDYDKKTVIRATSSRRPHAHGKNCFTQSFAPRYLLDRDLFERGSQSSLSELYQSI
jgi:hypothetical protein